MQFPKSERVNLKNKAFLIGFLFYNSYIINVWTLSSGIDKLNSKWPVIGIICCKTMEETQKADSKCDWIFFSTIDTSMSEHHVCFRCLFSVFRILIFVFVSGSTISKFKILNFVLWAINFLNDKQYHLWYSKNKSDTNNNGSFWLVID